MKTEWLEKQLEFNRKLLNMTWRKKHQPLSPQGYPYASFNIRMMAATLDSALVMLVISPFNGVLMAMAYKDLQVDTQAMNAALVHPNANLAVLKVMLDAGALKGIFWLTQVQVILMAIYSLICWHFWSSTPGKLVLRMRVVDHKTGGRITHTQAVNRIVGYLVAGLPFMIGIFAVAWNKQHRGWHDRLSGTSVIIERRSKAVPQAEPEPSATATDT